MSIVEFSYRRTPEKLQFLGEGFPFFFLESYSCFVMQCGDGEIVFLSDVDHIVPVRVFKSKFFRLAEFQSPPLDMNGKESDSLTFIPEALEYLKLRLRIDRVIQPPNYSVFANCPVNSKNCSFGSYQLDLTLGLDELWAGIHPKHKNKIRTAQKQDPVIKFGFGEVKVFYELYSKTMAKASFICPPLEFFEKLIACLGETNLLCAVIYKNDRPQGAVLVPFTEYCGYYVWGASAEKMELTGANNLLQWQVIQLLKAKGVKTYDFVGARLGPLSEKLKGIQEFKERFGGSLKKGYLWKQDLSKVPCLVYDLMIRINFRLKGLSLKGDIIDQEIAARK